ncbi:carboxypeptidase regulatory-like domain-containing protein [uncultured Prevotella sp.]|uniref:carboxypeptidase regulatory-like domain-containing protein n=1 Tax=uncultured Prevotella sp. TaxID=159272 RepID=UPI0025EA31BF|nr:carboxypeptidase regulatory-like domain-containing protein [uncultured Prevotella sp.]
MGSFVIYIIEWALCLSAFLLLYKMCFSGSTFHRFNRMFLLGSVVVSALLPLIHVTTTEQMEPIAEVCRLNTEQFEPLNTEFSTLSSEFSPLDSQSLTLSSQLSTSQRIFLAIALAYLIYICIQTVGWLRSLVKMILFLRGKRTHRVGRWIRLVVHNEEYGPFSWMNYIVISNKENGFGRRASMRHELSHIKLLHPLDLVFILLCTLVNPVCWLIMKEIKVVHEYEADDEVINHYQIQSRDYQRLLVLRTVGAEAYALACSFNLNIKKRIIMMKKKQSHWWRMMWIAVTFPLVGIALTAFSKPKEALKEVIDNSVEIIEQPIVEALSAETEEVEVIETPAPAPAPVKEVKAVDEVKPGDKISGSVKSKNGQPLQSVNLVEIDEYGRIVASSVTDKNGNFAFKVVNPKHKIRISYVGFKSLTLDINSNKIDATLEEAMVISNISVHTQPLNIDNDALNTPYFKDDVLPADDDKVFNVAEEMPKYPGGNQKIFEYLAANLRYPTVSREMLVDGEVVVKFIVGKTGLIRSPRVIEVNTKSPLITYEVTKAAKADDEEAKELLKNYQDAIEALKEEAIHVVRNMPRWEPGRQNGKRIDTPFTLPVNFSLAQ